MLLTSLHPPTALLPTFGLWFRRIRLCLPFQLTVFGATPWSPRWLCCISSPFVTFALDKAKVTITKRSKRLETMDKLEARLAKLEKEILTRPTHHCVQGQTFPSLSQHFNPFSIRDLQASYSDNYFCCKSVPAPVQTVAPSGYGSTKSVTTPSLHHTRVFALAVIGSPPLP